MATVANIYARAFADVVMGNRLDPGKTLQEVQSLSALVVSSRELREVWETPSIPAEQKVRVLDAIVAQYGISGPVRNFVAVLIDHRRVHFLAPVVAQFEKELNARLGFAEAELRLLTIWERTSGAILSNRLRRSQARKCWHAIPKTRRYSVEQLCGWAAPSTMDPCKGSWSGSSKRLFLKFFPKAE